MNSAWRAAPFLSEYADAMEGKTILVAGCGADGSHAAMGLAILSNGRVNLKLSDPDDYAIENLGIQVATRSQIGRNKAVATSENIRDIYPNMSIEVNEEGVTPENIDNLIKGCDLVVDATDIAVTQIAGDLHRNACEQGLPVVVPWSLGFGGAMIAFINQGDFEEWGRESKELARNLGVGYCSEVAQWLLYAPRGLSPEVIRRVLEGELPTPTTFFGATTGGHIAARWAAAWFRYGLEDVFFYPYTYLNKAEILNSETSVVNYSQELQKTLEKLRREEVDVIAIN